MNKKSLFILCVSLFFSFLECSNIVSSFIWSCGSRGAQEVSNTICAEGGEMVPEILQDDKLEKELHEHLQKRHPTMIFVKRPGNDITAHRNIIYIGAEWEAALIKERDDFLPLFEQVIDYYWEKNINRFYDNSLANMVVLDVGIGVLCWKKFLKLHRTLPGRLKIAGITCAAGMIITNTVNTSLNAVYDWAHNKPKSSLVSENG